MWSLFLVRSSIWAIPESGPSTAAPPGRFLMRRFLATMKGKPKTMPRPIMTKRVTIPCKDKERLQVVSNNQICRHFHRCKRCLSRKPARQWKHDVRVHNERSIQVTILLHVALTLQAVQSTPCRNRGMMTSLQSAIVSNVQ